MLQHLLTRAHAALGETLAALGCAMDMVEACKATRRPIDRYKTSLAIGDLLSCAGRHELAATVFQSGLEICREAELTNYVYTAEAQLAELDLRSDAHERGEHTLERLLAIEAGGLNPVPRLSAEAALLCHRLHHKAGTDLSQIEDLLARVRKADLPGVELRILETLAHCDPTGSRDWAMAAKAILAEQGYALCTLSDAEANAVMEDWRDRRVY